jgi:hypothetical protein
VTLERRLAWLSTPKKEKKRKERDHDHHFACFMYYFAGYMS